jgi:MGT family glycosyltransferase
MKVLAYTSPARGHLFPLVPILDELVRRGHAVALKTLASEVPLMRDRGFDASPIAPAIEAIPIDDFQARTPNARIKRAMGAFGRRAEHDLADLREAIDAHDPDALLVDCMTWGASAAAESWGGPWAQWFPYPLPLSSRDVPPFGPGLAPLHTPVGRIRDRVLRAVVEPPVARATLPAVNAVRARAGVPEVEDLDAHFSLPPLLLYMTAEPFEYPRSDWPASVLPIGPCPWDPPADPPAWLADVDRPIVLVSTSSEFQDDGRLVTTALDALADEEVEVIATLPSAELPTGSIPANARVERFIPHAPILERAACAITHGGAGATQKALAAGVPVCVVPFGRDQLGVARRVEVAGAGTRLPAPRLKPERLRERVLQAMTMTAGARRVADGFAAAGGPAKAADAFEALARAGQSSPSRV